MLSKLGLSSLTRQQKSTLMLLAVFNLVVFTLAIIALTDTPPPLLKSGSPPTNNVECEGDAALSLRQFGVAASVTITNNAMLVNVSGPDWAAAWDVFSATVKIAEAGCGPYNLIRVDVPDPEHRPNLRLVLELVGPEIQAWADGKINDEQLAERTRRTVYQRAPIPTPTSAH